MTLNNIEEIASFIVEDGKGILAAVSYTHLRAHETPEHRGCRGMV